MLQLRAVFEQCHALLCGFARRFMCSCTAVLVVVCALARQRSWCHAVVLAGCRVEKKERARLRKITFGGKGPEAKVTSHVTRVLNVREHENSARFTHGGV